MVNPYKIPSPALISFSGGRTSALIKYCVHNVSGKRYRINQKTKMFRHNFNVKIEQDPEYNKLQEME